MKIKDLFKNKKQAAKEDAVVIKVDKKQLASLIGGEGEIIDSYRVKTKLPGIYDSGN